MFEWKPQYSVQIPSIDGQHQNLFRIAAELYAAMGAGQGKAALSKILDRLTQYTTVHFGLEERLMRQTHYPGLEEHRRQHQAFTKQVQTFQSDFEAGRALLTVELFRFLQDWLQDHICETDRQYAPYLKNTATV